MNEINKQDNKDSVGDVSLRIAQTLASVKKMSERIIGYVQYKYQFVSQKYNAVSNRPAKITPLERAVVGILKIDSNQDLVTMGSILGLDVLHDSAEKEILSHAIESMRNYGVVEGGDDYMALTEKGNIFASTGERPESYNGTFDLWIDPEHPTFTELKNSLKADCVEDAEDSIEKVNLSFDKIKEFAEQQASNFQAAKLRYVLSEATFDSQEAKKYNLYVCFLQSVRDDNVTTFVYDDYQKQLLPKLSEVFDRDFELKQQLLDKCISIEVENKDDDTEVLKETTEKTHEQTVAEKQLIEDEDNANKNEKSKIAIGNFDSDGHLHKKALYDSLSFEAELHNIFVNDNADEIWMVSPWVGKAFVYQRLPYIQNFLKLGKKIFIAYSKEETLGKAASLHGKMIDPEAQKVVSNLSSKYPDLFFCVQLPAFHTKNVIEKKGEQCILFTGSFNVLSFSVNEKMTQIRREEMALAHHQMAINKYEEYLNEFINYYINKTKAELADFESNDKDEEIVNYKHTSIDTLVSMSGHKEDYLDFFNEVETKQLLAKNALWSKEVEELRNALAHYFETGVIPNKEKHNLDKRFANLTRRYVNLTVSIEEKEKFDDLYSKFKDLPSGKHALAKNGLGTKNAKQAITSDVSLVIYSKMKDVLNNKHKGRFIQFEDVRFAKKLSGPQNQLATETDLLYLLVALNLLSTAIRTKVEKKMKLDDVYNSLKRIIKRGNDFPELSIFTTEHYGKTLLIFDIHGVQFRFDGVKLSSEQLQTIKDRDNKIIKWDGTQANFHSCELLDLLNNK